MEDRPQRVLQPDKESFSFSSIEMFNPLGTSFHPHPQAPPVTALTCTYMDFVRSYCTNTVHLHLSIIIFSKLNPLPDSTDDTPDQQSTSPTSPLYSANTSAALSFLVQQPHHCCLSCWETRASCDEKRAHSVKFHPAACSFLVSQVSPCI